MNDFPCTDVRIVGYRVEQYIIQYYTKYRICIVLYIIREPGIRIGFVLSPQLILINTNIYNNNNINRGRTHYRVGMADAQIAIALRTYIQLYSCTVGTCEAG